MHQDVTSGVEKKQGRRMLLLLVGLFVLPIVLVMGMYHFDWRPGGASHGELIAPPRALQMQTLRKLPSGQFGAEQWKNKWSLVYIDRGDCAQACQEQVRELRQVHASLNKEIERLQRVLLVPVAMPPESVAGLQQQYPDLIVLAGEDVAQVAAQFDLPGQPATQSGRVYLVDPLGNLMMSYPQGHDPKGLRDDLTRLLKYSWVG